MIHSSYVKFFKKNTDEHISDDNNRHIPAGNDYMVCSYLEKI